MGKLLTDILDGIKNLISLTWDWCKDIWDIFLEYLWWIGEWFWDTFQDFLDWSVGLVLDFFTWGFDQLPSIDLPSGWEDGLSYFIGFGKLLNQIFPVTELFVLISLWLGIFVVLITVKYVWRLIINIIP